MDRDIIEARLIFGIPNKPKKREHGIENHIMNLRVSSFITDAKHCMNATNIYE